MAATTDDSKTGATPVPMRRDRKPKTSRVADASIERETAASSAAAVYADDAEQSASPAARARRGRPAKDAAAMPSSQPIADQPNEMLEAESPTASPVAAAPSTSPEPSAARWDPATGSASFDWPAIEQVAATDGPNQAMARLLLAARAEGANSRWPF